MSRKLNDFHSTSIAILSAIAILGGLAVPALGQVPFTCNGQAFVTQDPRQGDDNVTWPPGRRDNYLYLVDLSAWPSDIGFAAVKRLESPDGTPIVVNPVGFRSTDGLLYGWRRGPRPRQMVKIDAEGTVFPLGTAGLPNEAFVAGDIKPDGSEMYFVSVGTISPHNPLRLYKVPLSDAGPGTATFVPITLGGLSEDPSIDDPDDNVVDWAVSPSDEHLYGVDSEGHLAELNPTTGERIDRSVEDLPSSGKGYGAAWFNAAGRLFLYKNDNGPNDLENGTVYEIDVTGRTIENSLTTLSSRRNDGAFCTAGEACSGHGDLIASECVCDPGWGGTQCEECLPDQLPPDEGECPPGSILEILVDPSYRCPPLTAAPRLYEAATWVDNAAGATPTFDLQHFAYEWFTAPVVVVAKVTGPAIVSPTPSGIRTDVELEILTSFKGGAGVGGHINLAYWGGTYNGEEHQESGTPKIRDDRRLLLMLNTGCLIGDCFDEYMYRGARTISDVTETDEIALESILLPLSALRSIMPIMEVCK